MAITVVGDPQLFIILYVSWALPTQSTATKSLPAQRFNWQVPVCNVEFPISKLHVGWVSWSYRHSMTQLSWGSNAFPSEIQGETLLQLGWVFCWRWHGLNWPDRGDLEHATYCLFLNQYCTNNLPYIHEIQDESQPPQQRQQQQCWEIEHDWTEGLW